MLFISILQYCKYFWRFFSVLNDDFRDRSFKYSVRAKLYCLNFASFKSTTNSDQKFQVRLPCLQAGHPSSIILFVIKLQDGHAISNGIQVPLQLITLHISHLAQSSLYCL